ncbi:MAG: sigma 54-interacting transcriptional regulator [Acidobacteriota bacterium]
MNAPAPLDLSPLLRFEEEEGRIWLDDYRMLLLSACALGALRQELIESLGWDTARGVLKRFGYAAGLGDAVAMRERFPDATPEQLQRLGPQLHALEGMAKVVRHDKSESLAHQEGLQEENHATKAPHLPATEPAHSCGDLWLHSFEAEQHLDLIGPAQEPICWTLAGYAAGHASASGDQRVIVSEVGCRAMGDEHCRFVVTTASEHPELYAREAPDYAPRHLPRELQQLHEALAAKESTIARLRAEADAPPRGGFIGESRSLDKALETARAVAPYASSVLIQGESGTGKELLARFVHEQSKVAERPFLAVNCSALPETLQEAELFGHAKGAFTGADAARAGVFEAAHGGTLFLDEIGDLSLSAQTKILRALQEGEIKRLGETRTRKARPRIIAATHQDLEAMVIKGTFREDLYYRLGVVVVQLPPLRTRGNDVLLLADHFLRVYSHRFEKEVRGLSREAAAALLSHDWPGNVRELENAIQRAVILSSGPQVQAESLPERLFAPQPLALDHGPNASAAPLQNRGDERASLLEALERTGGHREQAAALLGISRTTLWRRIKNLKLDEGEETSNGQRLLEGKEEGDS